MTIENILVFDRKNKHCYKINSSEVGTRNRVTVSDIYGRKSRRTITNFTPMTEFEAFIVPEGERITRRKAAMTAADSQIAYCYRKYAALNA
jgi:hypothetical protein